MFLNLGGKTFVQEIYASVKTMEEIIGNQFSLTS